MKRLGLVLAIMMITGVAQAKIIGEVIGQELTEDKFIKISTKFIDDKDTTDKTDDEQVGTIDYRLWNPLRFENKTSKEIIDIVKNDLEKKIKGNTIYQYMKNKGGNPLTLLRKEKAQNIFEGLSKISIKLEQINLKTKMDIDGDGYCEEEWTIKPNGTESRVSITPGSCD
ncbi:MAG: hypothetical protein JRJ39_00010 [Deltaproteobacteria bacterium]|nr:hypothetical protein [Deltaproteobacteria bacterium]